MLRGKRIASKRSVKHLMAAVTRYGDRLGSQFAGAMTYFSFLSLVPDPDGRLRHRRHRAAATTRSC